MPTAGERDIASRRRGVGGLTTDCVFGPGQFDTELIRFGSDRYSPSPVMGCHYEISMTPSLERLLANSE